MTTPRERPGRRRRAGDTGRKVAASLATVVAAAGVVALPTFGAFTDQRTHFTDSVLAPPPVDPQQRDAIP
ncbi:hypothetical protein [Modestobacter lapidis]|nr:hypothetical protein [Modestobacter lapidis]